jgi:L-threonylcarbamoyladenylate synthase
LTAKDIGAALRALVAGELVIVPTETVYGLAADASNASAVAKIYEAKGRPSFNPLISHVADLDSAERLAVFDDRSRALARAFWPGPITLVAPFRAGAPVCDLARAGLDTLALRVPAHPLALDLLRRFGGAVAAPSANRSGRPSPTRFADAMEETGASAAAALDGGACRIGLESTVVAVLDGKIQLLRPGGIERAAIEAVVGPLGGTGSEAHRSPGRLALHYAPNAPVRLEATMPEPGEAYLAFGPWERGAGVWNLSPTGDLREAAANLFTFLREADHGRPRAIAVATIPQDGLGEAINDRLRRAAGFIG